MDVGRHRCREELQGSGSLCHREGLAGEGLAALTSYRRKTKTGRGKSTVSEKRVLA